MSLCIEKRGLITNQTYLTTERVELTFDMPLAEIVFDFTIVWKRFLKVMRRLIIRQ
jgi:translation elongation factor EF-4